MATPETYVPWVKKDGFTDLTPVPQDDAPNCLVPIAYDEMCRSPLLVSLRGPCPLADGDQVPTQTATAWTRSARLSPREKSRSARSRSRSGSSGSTLDTTRSGALLNLLHDAHQSTAMLTPSALSYRKYRADTLLALQSSMTDELDLLDQLVKFHLKSYQVWFVVSRGRVRPSFLRAEG